MTTTSESEGRVAPVAARPRAPLGPRVLGAVVLAVGIFLLWTAYESSGGDLALDGPWLAPLVVTAGWVLVSAWYLVAQFIGPRPATEPPAEAATGEPGDEPTAEAADAEPGEPTAAADATAEPADEPAGEAADAEDAADRAEPGDGRVQWLTPAALAATLVGYVLLLEPVGFLLASALFFVLVARILGSPRLVRDVVIAVLLVLAIYLAFTRLLTIQLPSGVLPL
ncbi:tripartite tricarboxylate transporter TctB family protein [Micromonospora sp. NPDC049559]|uniref:tripartite tricarboxylate transporter TctB family protein n=1 Tax=Micromonospora sp. NPDC049559 TaxID=3155923 RepID=UPI0034336AAE